MSLHNETTRSTRLRKIEHDIARTGKRMRELAKAINLTWGTGVFRVRTHIVAGVLSLRFYWRDDVENIFPGEKPRSSFELTSKVGLRLLESQDDESRARLISLARKAGLLNHQYRVLFCERRSLRKFGAADQQLLEIRQEIKTETERGNEL